MARVRISEEERKRRKREKERERRRKIRDDPIKKAEQREYEKQKYLRKRQSKIRKTVAEMTDREHRKQKKQWREYSKAHRMLIKKNNDENDQNKNNIQTAENLQNASVRVDGRDYARKRSIKINVQRHREKLSMKKTIMYLVRKVRKYKKRFHRLKNKTKTNKKNAAEETSMDTPVTRVNIFLQESRSNDAKVEEVKKQLLFGEVVKDQLSETYKTLKSTREKRVFKKIILGRVIKKYKLQTTCSQTFNFRRTTNPDTKSLLTDSKTKGTRFYREQELKRKIQVFLEEDVNSRICPGKKDYVTKNKVSHQKRYLTNTLKNLFTEFGKQNPDVTISYTTFCRAKPFWIKSLKVTDRDSCQCVDANMALIISSLWSNKVFTYKTTSQVLQVLTCNYRDENCLLRNCTACLSSKVVYSEEVDANKMLPYYEWVKLKQSFFNKRAQVYQVCNKIGKARFELKALELISKFESKLVLFMSHVARIRHQYNAIKELKLSMTEQDILIHCDFSENYSLKFAEEVQSFHFGGSRQQITLHTVVAYTKLSNELKIESFCTVSESLEHNPAAVWAHLYPVLKYYNKKGIKNLHFLSDSPATQYRNKKMFSFIANNFQDYFPEMKEVTWNYCEPGHGKGAPDGIGGVCKRTVDRIVAQGQDVATFNDFVGVLKENCPGVLILEVFPHEIVQFSELINNNKIIPFVGTMKVRQVKGIAGTKRLWLRKLSCFQCSRFCEHYELGTLDYYEKNTGDSSDCSSTINFPASRDILKKLDIDEVYSSSDDDIPLAQYKDLSSVKVDLLRLPRNTAKFEVNAQPSTSKPPPLIQIGTYILVGITTQVRKKLAETTYKYVAMCNSELDIDGELKVTFLKLCDGDNQSQIFRLNEYDVSYITEEQILEILPSPKLMLRGQRVFYKFEKAVDVFERA